MRREQQWHIKERYEKLKSELYSPNSFPYVNSIFNLPSFIRENEALYVKLLSQLRELRKHHESIQKRDVKIKTTPFYLQNLISSTTNQDDEALTDLKSKNQILKASISRLREEKAKRLAQEAPLIKEKQKQLQEKRQEVEKLAEQNRLLKRASENEDLLELYQLKCRQCESLRVVNNNLSDELKGLINELNKMTGNEQNPNMFLLTLGIR